MSFTPKSSVTEILTRTLLVFGARMSFPGSPISTFGRLSGRAGILNGVSLTPRWAFVTVSPIQLSVSLVIWRFAVHFLGLIGVRGPMELGRRGRSGRAEKRNLAAVNWAEGSSWIWT